MASTTKQPPTSAVTARSATEEASAAAELLAPLTSYLDDMSTRAAGRLGTVAGVAITMAVSGIPFTVGASSDLARDVDLIQYEIGAGPCLHALRNGVGQYVPDLATDDRWGQYGPRAAARGARSCISVPVLHEDHPAAVFKVYSAEVDGLSQAQRDSALAATPEIAGGIGLVVLLARQAQAIDDRVAAMSSRRVIDLAIGIVMERLHIDADAAFSLLRSISQTRNVKLRAVAADIVAGLPTGTSDAPNAPFRERRQSGGHSTT